VADDNDTKDDSKSELMSEFEEFLAAKQAKQEKEKEEEDFEVEIWDEKGRGVRTRRSHAKPFLQSVGLDLDPDPKGDAKADPDKKTPTRTAKSQSAAGVAKKYFAKKSSLWLACHPGRSPMRKQSTKDCLPWACQLMPPPG
jgi:hypothetical protein